MTCGVWNDCLWIELSWHQFKQNESGFHWKGMSCSICRRLVLKCDWKLTIIHIAKLEVILPRWKLRYFFAVVRRKRRENIRGMCINSDFTFNNITLNHFFYFVYLDDSCAIIYKIWKTVIFKCSFSLFVARTST